MLPETMAGLGGKIINVRVPHVNHMEMGNHREMREIFEKAYNGYYDKTLNLHE